MNLTLSANCWAFEPPILDQVLPPILILEFMFGSMGNLTALWMFIFHTWGPNSVYLTHLAVADSIGLFCQPFPADYYRRAKNCLYADVLCRILLFLLAANRAAGIFSLAAVAVDRNFNIVHPMNRINRTGLGYALWVSLGLWALIFLATFLPMSTYSPVTTAHNVRASTSAWASNLWTFHNAFYVIQFSLPTVTVAFCTITITWQLKSRTVDRKGKLKRAVQFVLAVASIFITYFLAC